jgi:hypothetical protein
MDGLDQDDPATGKRGVEHRTLNAQHRTSKWKKLKKWIPQSNINDPSSNPSVGVELVILDRLDGDCGGGSEDGFLIGGAGDLGGGAGEAEDELAVATRAGDMLEELERDVCGVEVREDQDIGAATGFGSGSFDFGCGGVECDIGLDFAFDVDFEKLAMSFGLRE